LAPAKLRYSKPPHNTTHLLIRLQLSQRHAIATPLLNKTGPDHADMSNLQTNCCSNPNVTVKCTYQRIQCIIINMTAKLTDRRRSKKTSVVITNSFISKVIERAVVSQLTEYLSAKDLLPCFQSAYRRKHSTERASVVCVVSVWCVW